MWPARKELRTVLQSRASPTVFAYVPWIGIISFALYVHVHEGNGSLGRAS